jgi:hypothetical protein
LAQDRESDTGIRAGSQVGPRGEAQDPAGAQDAGSLPGGGVERSRSREEQTHPGSDCVDAVVGEAEIRHRHLMELDRQVVPGGLGAGGGEQREIGVDSTDPQPWSSASQRQAWFPGAAGEVHDVSSVGQGVQGCQ